MKIIEMRLREIGFVLWGHCQNLLDDPRIIIKFIRSILSSGTFCRENSVMEIFLRSFFLFRSVDSRRAVVS